jgi:hypothetical protein
MFGIDPPRWAKDADEGCPYRRVLCARAESEASNGLRCLGWGKVKGRSPVAREPRPMIEAGAPSTGAFICPRHRVCPPHRG